jgi:hypothetical protein
MKKLILCFSILSLLCTISSCAQTGTIIYKDVPADCVIIKRDTLSKIIGEFILTKRELMECLEREK